MRILAAVLMLSFVAALAPAPAQPNRSPIASNPIVTFDGKIRKVQIAPGQGTPFLEVQSEDQVTKVYLGSMRYLMEQNFNPQAGDAVNVKGYKMNPDVVAISVTLTANKRTLKLRDENGWPVWGRGMMVRGRGASPGTAEKPPEKQPE
jgi:hypothetical protein